MIQVQWNETDCVHSANCVKKLPNVFKVENGQFVIDESGALADLINTGLSGVETSKKKMLSWPFSKLNSPPQASVFPSAERCI